MNLDEPKEPSEGRKRLEALEKEGKYVFHGALIDIQSLEPKQGYNQNKETGEMVKDGDPAVFATPYSDVAIFRSLINSENVQGNSTSEWGMADDGKIFFRATQNLLDAAKNKTGKIYVLDKKYFGEVKGTEARSEKNVIPDEVIEVYFVDLPKNIEIIK